MKSGLDLTYERSFWNLGVRTVAGVDEVGRGCLAGPVVAACVVFPVDHEKIEGINDSKQLTARKRERLAALIREQAEYIGIGAGSVDMIDTKGIVAATGFAMRQAVKPKADVIVVDGNLLMGLDDICAHVEPVVGGDGKIYSIAAASIVAKVYRDALMVKIHTEFPDYLWRQNKGYGTKAHFQAIAEHGTTFYHRKSFLNPSILAA